MTLKNDMKECPFCNSKDVKSESWMGTSTLFSVHCKECGTRGPTSNVSKQDAIVRWNKRSK